MGIWVPTLLFGGLLLWSGIWNSLLVIKAMMPRDGMVLLFILYMKLRIPYLLIFLWFFFIWFTDQSSRVVLWHVQFWKHHFSPGQIEWGASGSKIKGENLWELAFHTSYPKQRECAGPSSLAGQLVWVSSVDLNHPDLTSPVSGPYVSGFLHSLLWVCTRPSYALLVWI